MKHHATEPTRLCLVLLGLLFLLMSSCAFEPAGTPGALKEGGFVYCDDPTSGCDGDAAIPDHIAVGSTFGISFSGDGATLSSPSTDELETIPPSENDVGHFRAVQAGEASVQARAQSDGKLIDFVTLELDDIGSVKLSLCPRAWNAIVSPGQSFDETDCGDGDAGTSNIEITQSESLSPTVCAFPLDDSANDLAGHLPFEWTRAAGSTADLELNVASDGRCATIGGLTPGAANITVVTGNVRSAFDVTVNP